MRRRWNGVKVIAVIFRSVISNGMRLLAISHFEVVMDPRELLEAIVEADHAHKRHPSVSLQMDCPMRLPDSDRNSS